MIDFSGKVALVTGSSSGIGAAIAKELASAKEVQIMGYDRRRQFHRAARVPKR